MTFLQVEQIRGVFRNRKANVCVFSFFVKEEQSCLAVWGSMSHTVIILENYTGFICLHLMPIFLIITL